MSVTLTAIEVRPGDIIVEGHKRIQVRRVELSQNSCQGVHINSTMCYNRAAPVEVEGDESK